MSDELVVVPYVPISPLEIGADLGNGALASLDALRDEWERRLGELTEQERVAIRQRSLRRLAIETGILERLYDIDWGLTLTLVAEGFTRDVIERHSGRIDDSTRATLEAHRDSLEMVLDYVRHDRPLSVSFVRELHSAITRTQQTYRGQDLQGRPIELELHHGAWKQRPNHVDRSDHTRLEYAPPEHVASEMDRLVAWYLDLETTSTHPVILAAWLHHRFVQIHPFEDGNGRVARALVLLVLQKHRFAPLVVDRFHRDAYLKALDAANAGDLKPLVRLFVNLAGASLTSELEAPTAQAPSTSTQVAHTLAEQLRALRRSEEIRILDALRPRALQVGAQLQHWFETKASELERLFRTPELRELRILRDHQIGDQAPRGFWFHEQIVAAARRIGYLPDLRSFRGGWSGLRLRYRDTTLRFVAALHRAGRGSGVLAVVTFAEIEVRWEDEEGVARTDRRTIETTADALRIVHTEPTESINSRADELSTLLDEGLTIALAEFSRELS
jgi:fido (protein-threonine AMPylation protein)